MDIVKINPEHLEVAKTYLECMDIAQTAYNLGIPITDVSDILDSSDVKRFIDNVFLDQGYMNKFKISTTLNNIIDKKLEELEEAEMGSSKDIADLLDLAHKMRMQELKAQIALEEAKNKNPKNQTNVQINSYGENYNELIKKILKV